MEETRSPTVTNQIATVIVFAKKSHCDDMSGRVKTSVCGGYGSSNPMKALLKALFWYALSSYPNLTSGEIQFFSIDAEPGTVHFSGEFLRDPGSVDLFDIKLKIANGDSSYTPSQEDDFGFDDDTADVADDDKEDREEPDTSSPVISKSEPTPSPVILSTSEPTKLTPAPIVKTITTAQPIAQLNETSTAAAPSTAQLDQTLTSPVTAHLNQTLTTTAQPVLKLNQTLTTTANVSETSPDDSGFGGRRLDGDNLGTYVSV